MGGGRRKMAVFEETCWGTAFWDQEEGREAKEDQGWTVSRGTNQPLEQEEVSYGKKRKARPGKKGVPGGNPLFPPPARHRKGKKGGLPFSRRNGPQESRLTRKKRGGDQKKGSNWKKS